MNIGSKTYVSVLNEYLISKGTNAKWELIHNETGTHNPTFIYKVEGLDRFATGEGRSKQMAKQEAARALIELLKILDDEKVAEEVTRTPTLPEETNSFNAVGQLADYCAANKHPEPEYDTIKEDGPPHAKIFVVQCAVSGIHELGESGKKKVAKQISAANMLRRLKIQAGEEVNAVVPVGVMKSPEKKTLEFDEDEVIEKYAQLSVSSYIPPPAVKYKDHQQAHVGIHNNSPTLAKIISGELDYTPENAVELLDEIVKELKISKDLIKYQTRKDNKSKEGENKDESNPQELYLYKITTSPELNAIGNDESSAANNLIDTLIVMNA